MKYTSGFIAAIYVLFVVITSSYYLVRVTRWIKTEAKDNKSKTLKRTVKKNDYLIANDVLAIILIVYRLVSLATADTPLAIFGTSLPLSLSLP